MKEVTGWFAYRGIVTQQHEDVGNIFKLLFDRLKPKRILEIGTASGGLTLMMRDILDEINLNDTHIRSYDVVNKHFLTEHINNGVKIEVLIKNIFNHSYTELVEVEEIKSYIQQDGLTIVLCDGASKKNEFRIISDYLKDGDIIMGHDYFPNETYFLNSLKDNIWNWMEIQDSDIEESVVRNNLTPYMSEEFNKVVWVCKMKNETNGITNVKSTPDNTSIKKSNITLVTGIWNIGREELSEGWSRTYKHYLTQFEKLLGIDENLIIFGDEELMKFVFEIRNHSNTQFIIRSLSWFRNNDYYEKIQEIRNKESWYNQVGWLKDSTQARLEMYNPLVMSKMFLLNDAKILDKFDSDYMFWIDGGLTNTVHPGYFTHDNVLEKLPKLINKFTFVCFPYETVNEIHGFDYSKINSLTNSKVNKVARGGFFGGPKNTISDINTIYYSLLKSTLSEGYMGTEESIFTIMCYNNSDLIDYFEIESNGLLGKFFEDLKNDKAKIKNEKNLMSGNDLDINKTALYVITFNSPKQFETLIESMIEYDKDFILKPKKYLLDNSTDLSTTPKYKDLCDRYGFEHIKKDNLGIVGGRVFVAEHFDKTGLDFQFWFEDDMAFYLKKDETCRNGFNRYVPNLYQKSLEITKKENFDFLKLNFSEFYGDNSIQWSWYNTPQSFREKNWPEKPNLPTQGLDPNAPNTVFKKIKSYNGLPYASGEIYLCNWPIILTKSGNYKCYLETKWAFPYEQTLMSYSFQETIKGNINPGILLLTPTEHNRFEHYEKSLRKES